MTWELSIAGLLVGALVGMTGMGGGSLMTPMLILIFGFNPKTAVGTDILHGAVFKSFGAVRHRQLGNEHVPLALWMLAGSAPLSLVGVQIASSFSDSTQTTMRKVVGGALIPGGVGFAIKAFVRGAARPDDDEQGRRGAADPRWRRLCDQGIRPGLRRPRRAAPDARPEDHRDPDRR